MAWLKDFVGARGRKMITKDFLHEILDYDQETGVFRWKKRTSMSIKVGDIAGRAYKVGYRVIKIKRVLYLAHRLAWLYMFGMLAVLFCSWRPTRM